MRQFQTVTVSFLLVSACLGYAAPASSVIDVEVRFLLFDRQDIDAITKEKSIVAVDDLTALCKKGKSSNLVPPLKAASVTGQEATVKAVVERIYPTTYSVVPCTRNSAAVIAGVIEPGMFQMREIGAIFSWEATLLDEDPTVIEMTMAPQVVVELASSQYPRVRLNEGRLQADIPPLEHPLFKIFTASASLSLRDGETIVIGSQSYGQDDKVLFFLVTAKIRVVSSQTSQVGGAASEAQPKP